MKMNNQKILIIDGLYTIYSNGYFVKDVVPRILARYIDDGFGIWFININSIEEEIFEMFDMPSWTRQSIKSFSIDDVVDMKKLSFDNKSLLISDNIKRADAYKLNIRVESSVNFFEASKYEPKYESDIIIAFGFNTREFTSFCKNKNLLGVEGDNLVNVKNGYDGISILVQTDIVKDEVDFGIGCLENFKNEGIYKAKYNNRVLGVTLKGKGLEGKNLDLNGVNIPLLLV